MLWSVKVEADHLRCGEGWIRLLGYSTLAKLDVLVLARECLRDPQNAVF